MDLDLMETFFMEKIFRPFNKKTFKIDLDIMEPAI
jgi:hypothetical protein